MKPVVTFATAVAKVTTGVVSFAQNDLVFNGARVKVAIAVATFATSIGTFHKFSNWSFVICINS